MFRREALQRIGAAISGLFLPLTNLTCGWFKTRKKEPDFVHTKLKPFQVRLHLFERTLACRICKTEVPYMEAVTGPQEAKLERSSLYLPTFYMVCQAPSCIMLRMKGVERREQAIRVACEVRETPTGVTKIVDFNPHEIEVVRDEYLTPARKEFYRNLATALEHNKKTLEERYGKAISADYVIPFRTIVPPEYQYIWTPPAAFVKQVMEVQDRAVLAATPWSMLQAITLGQKFRFEQSAIVDIGDVGKWGESIVLKHMREQLRQRKSQS